MDNLSKKNTSGTARVAAVIEQAIRDGAMASGERLDSVRNLASRFGVGMMVVIRALDVLEKKNLIVRHPRKGVFVAEQFGNNPRRRILLLCDCGNADPSFWPGFYFNPQFERICREKNWSVETIDITFLSSSSREKTLEVLTGKNFDGCISLGSYYIGSELSLRILKDLNMPTVFAAAQPGDAEVTGFPSLVYSPYEAWRMAVQFLAGRGYHSIGAIGSHGRDGVFSLRCSHGEHFELLRHLNLTIPERPLCYFDYRDSTGAKACLETFLDGYKRFDAILCHSDFHAALVYEYCFLHHIRIPEDLAVMGIGCYTGRTLLAPALSSVDFHYEQTAAKAAGWLENPPPRGSFELWNMEVLPGQSTR